MDMMYSRHFWIQYYVDYLNEDELPFGYLIETAKNDLKLQAGDVEFFLVECISAILASGGVPITIEYKADMMQFVQNKKYGIKNEEIISNIMIEWKRKGGENYEDKNYPFCDPWFGHPNYKWQKIPIYPDP